MRLLFLGFSSPVAGLEATERKVAQEWLEMKVSICGERFPVDRPGLGEWRGGNVPPFARSPITTKASDFSASDCGGCGNMTAFDQKRTVSLGLGWYPWGSKASMKLGAIQAGALDTGGGWRKMGKIVR